MPLTAGKRRSLERFRPRSAQAGWVRSIARDTQLTREVALKILPGYLNGGTSDNMRAAATARIDGASGNVSVPA